MENDKLTQLWNSQENELTLEAPDVIIKKAKKQRSTQYISITVMSITLLIILAYALYYATNNWNDFALGLVLMISSLAFRIPLEFLSLYRKESQLIALDSKAFKAYLKRHYNFRLKINYIITPICFIIYIIGFTKLLPYFKQEFSEGFYTYLLISGFVSIFVVALIVLNSIRKESKFLKALNVK